MGLTSRLAAWAVNTSFSDIPGNVIEKSRQMMFNSAAAGLAVATQKEVDIISQYVQDMEAKPQSTVMGRGIRTSPHYAAFANGVMMDLPDYDGAVRRRSCSSHRVVAPAVMALGEQLALPGRKVIAAYTVGCEVATKVAAVDDLDAPVKPRMARYEWDLGAVAGTIGAAAGAGKLLDLSQEQMESALAIAVSQASGVTVSFGNPVLATEMGLAAMKGIIAANLAQRGITGARNAIEAENGLYGCYRRDTNIDEQEFFDRLANPYDVIHPGLLMKFYPCASPTGTPIEATLHLVKEHQITADQIKSVKARVPELNSVMFTRPETGLQGRKSIDFCVAVALVHGRPQLHHFSDAAVQDPRVRAVMEKVTWDETESASIEVPLPCTLTITLTDGRELSHRAKYEKGHPGNPLTLQELDTKFADCSRDKLSPDQIKKAIDQFHHLEELPNVAPLFSLLGGTAK